MTAATATTPHRVLRLPGLLAAATVLAQILYPLVSGDALNLLTVVTVALFTCATVGSVAVTRGGRDAVALLSVAAGAGFVAEVCGVHTGFPFGRYAYTRTLGAEVAGVPLVIPLAWAMMAWPALCVGRRLGHPVLAGAAALASWDLFLDPQMVHDGHWVWRARGPRLCGIPLVNDVGWLAVALVLLATLASLLPAGPAVAGRPDLPVVLWLWTWGSSVLANVAFFHRPLVALVGGLGMGVVGVPLLRSLARP